MKRNISVFRLSVMLLLLGGLAVSCTDNTPSGGAAPDDEVSGKINISADESLKPFVDSEVKTFTRFYNRAHITASYKSEAASIADLLKDSARMIVIPRKLTDAEMKQYTDKNIRVKMVKIAYDAIALIVNNGNTDSTMTLAHLNDIMHGRIMNWKELGGKNEKLKVVFDNSGSGALDYLKNRFAMKDSLPADFYALHSDDEVMHYVAKTPGALGFIGLNWITTPDSVSNSFTRLVKVMALSPPDTAKNAEDPYYLPYQENIALRLYPLTREIYGITPEFFNGLGTGFINFMGGEKGQIVARLAGILPAIMPPRFVHVKTNY